MPRGFAVQGSLVAASTALGAVIDTIIGRVIAAVSPNLLINCRLDSPALWSGIQVSSCNSR